MRSAASIRYDERYRASMRWADKPVAPAPVEAALWSSPEVRAIVDRARGLNAGAVVLRYRQGATVQQIADDLRVAWPTVHALIFDLRRAGVALPSRRRSQA